MPNGRRKRLLIGSHIDTVNDAGAYDGTLGVIAGILAAEHFFKSGLPVDIDVLAFGDEEGSRFPATLLCSSAVAGHFDTDALQVESVDGVRLDAALRAYGKDPGRIAEAAYAPDEVAAYVEVHIEQGPVLERQDQALGVVTAIAGQSRLMRDGGRRGRPCRHGANGHSPRRAGCRRRNDRGAGDDRPGERR